MKVTVYKDLDTNNANDRIIVITKQITCVEAMLWNARKVRAVMSENVCARKNCESDHNLIKLDLLRGK